MVQPVNCCRLCGATSYRRVVERDASGALGATSLFQCTGCSVVFADPKAWREGSGPQADTDDALRPPLVPRTPASLDSSAPAPTPANPDFKTYMLGPPKRRSP